MTYPSKRRLRHHCSIPPRYPDQKSHFAVFITITHWKSHFALRNLFPFSFTPDAGCDIVIALRHRSHCHVTHHISQISALPQSHFTFATFPLFLEDSPPQTPIAISLGTLPYRNHISQPFPFSFNTHCSKRRLRYHSVLHHWSHCHVIRLIISCISHFLFCSR